ncbi:MAG: hypothetical protein ISP91_03715 [Pseudomonadales bacterium]|jgi:acyl-CoA thioester hydrolase|nr:hypothetical protein [Pseudomonadales bacterium]
MSQTSNSNQPQLLHESRVTESQIDSLGHMNVRFYVERASAANQALLNRLGITPGNGQKIRRTDTFNRFHREQFEGALLRTFGGLVATEDRNGVTGYYEIRNEESGDVAATFIMTSQLLDTTTEELLPLKLDEQQVSEWMVEVPEYGRPRSLTLNEPRRPSFEEIEPLIPDDELLGGLSGRREGIVLKEDCDETGHLAEGTDLVHVIWRPQPGEDLRKVGPPHLRDQQGRLYSWAMMEIRSIVYQRPAAGETIVSLSTDVNYGEKWRHSRRWVFSKNSRELLGISDQTGICMDLEARRAINIPDEVRPLIEKYCLRDLA